MATNSCNTNSGLVDVTHDAVVCVGDYIFFHFYLKNEESCKKDSKGNIISGPALTDVVGTFHASLNLDIEDISVTKGSAAGDTWTVSTLREGSQANAIVKAKILEDCDEKYIVKLNFDKYKALCATKTAEPLTCCKIKGCVAKGELDCKNLTK